MSWLEQHMGRVVRDIKPGYAHGAGGRAEGMDDSEFDPEQLRVGTEHEKEHTDDPEVAKQTAKDHLVEHPGYYKALPKMERELEARGE